MRKRMLRARRVKAIPEKHGKKHTPEYQAWCDIIKRCYNKNCKRYSDYGGRGIDVCVQWQESFACFLRDMGPKPSEKHSIDRIDNDKGYAPENCRWADATAQSRNRRIRKDSKTGIRGVGWHEQRAKYRAYITVDGRQIHLGYFNDSFEAVCARKSAENKVWDQC